MIYLESTNGDFIARLNICDFTAPTLAEQRAITEPYLAKYGAVKLDLHNGTQAQTFYHPYYSLVTSDYFDTSSYYNDLKKVEDQQLYCADFSVLHALGRHFKVRPNNISITVKPIFSEEPLRSHLLPISDRVFAPLTNGAYDYSGIEITYTFTISVTDMEAAKVYSKVLSCQTEFGITSSLDSGSTELPIKLMLTKVHTMRKSMQQNTLFVPPTCNAQSLTTASNTKLNDLVNTDIWSVFHNTVKSKYSTSFEFTGEFDGDYPTFKPIVQSDNISLLDIATSVVIDSQTTHSMYVPSEVTFKLDDTCCIANYDVFDVDNTSNTNNCKTYI